MFQSRRGANSLNVRILHTRQIADSLLLLKAIVLASAISTLNPKVIIHQYGPVEAVLGIDQLLSDDQSHKSKMSGYN